MEGGAIVKTLIVGADRLGRVLAHSLLRAGHDVDVLEGSPLEYDTLAGAAAGCDALAAVSGDDALNAVVALAARRELHVPIAVAVIASPARAAALTGLGARILCPTAKIVHELQHTLVRSGIESELDLGGEAGVYRAELPARLSGRALSELERRSELVAVAVERNGHVLLATPELVLREGDVLHVAAAHRSLVADLTHP
jgi:trk system potassium uptake protein